LRDHPVEGQRVDLEQTVDDGPDHPPYMVL
jgi:hypothetical protein